MVVFFFNIRVENIDLKRKSYYIYVLFDLKKYLNFITCHDSEI